MHVDGSVFKLRELYKCKMGFVHFQLGQNRCDEHYLAYKLRNHKDYIPELDYVAVKDRKIIGNTIYYHSYLQDGD